MMKLKKGFFNFTFVKDPYWFTKGKQENVYDLHIKKLIHLKSVNHAILLQGENFYLNNIEWLLSRTNMTLRLKMMMQ